MRNVIVFLSLCVALTSAFWGAPVEAKNKHKHKQNAREIMAVVDESGPNWNPYVQATVDEFNAIMPPNGPLLVYYPGNTRLCTDTLTSVCLAVPDPRWSGYTIYQGSASAEVGLTDIRADPYWLDYVVCHEFMHVLARVPDDYVRNPDGTVTWFHPGTDSCVWSDARASPGSFDIQYLYDYYARDRSDHKDKKRRRH
jgi:hypothetical protein